MSIIAGGCFLSSERASDPTTKKDLTRAVTRFTADRHRLSSYIDALFAFGAFDISAEDPFCDCQPLAAQDRVIVWDGRLDNREDLLEEVRSPGGAAAITCDAHVIALAHAKWKEKFVSHLVGEFALALWDPSVSTVFLARDPFGVRPLYFARRGKEFWWSSELSLLLAISSSYILDESFVAGYLTYTEGITETPYRGIYAVTPGCIVSATANSISCDPYWSPAPTRSIKYRSDDQYEQHFRDLFNQSLACRLKAKGTVMCELSGGLDSSSIVCAANGIIQSGTVEATALETVSFLYDGSTTVDERPFMASVIAHSGVVNHALTDNTILSPDTGPVDYLTPNPHRAYLSTFSQVGEVMASRNSRLLFTGLCGDHVLMHDSSYHPIVADHILHGHFRTAHRILQSEALRLKTSYWQLFWKGAVWPTLPTSWRTRFVPASFDVPEWLDNGFIGRTNCRERLLDRKELSSSRNPFTQHRFNLLANAISASSAQRYREHLSIEVTMPYLHLPLVRFLLAIPPDQLIRPYENRSIQRRAMKGILPEEIRLRTTKRGPDEAAIRGIRSQWSYFREVGKDPLLARLGIIKPDKFLDALEKARFGYTHKVSEVFRTLSLEMWLRNRVAAGAMAV